MAGVCILALFASHAEAQEVDTTQFRVTHIRSWSPGQTSPIQAWVHYFVSRPDSQFTKGAVEEAVAAAMVHSGLPPDIVIPRGAPQSGAPYLRIQAERYESFALRLELAYIQPTGEDTYRELCHGESCGGYVEALAALLTLSHEVRDLIACVMDEVELKWPERSY